MKLIVHELMSDPLDQVVTPSKDTVVRAIRPHILRYGHPAGKLKLSILDESDVVLAESDLVEISDIETLDYFHGYVRFDIKFYMAKDVPYTLRLTGEDGYTFDESDYIGWVNGHDLAKYPSTEVPLSTLNAPLDYEIWERKVK